MAGAIDDGGVHGGAATATGTPAMPFATRRLTECSELANVDAVVWRDHDEATAVA